MYSSAVGSLSSGVSFARHSRAMPMKQVLGDVLKDSPSNLQDLTCHLGAT